MYERVRQVLLPDVHSLATCERREVGAVVRDERNPRLAAHRTEGSKHAKHRAGREIHNARSCSESFARISSDEITDHCPSQYRVNVDGRRISRAMRRPYRASADEGSRRTAQ
jgi:hypothetical protein